jgi:AraC family transcriptional regulator
MPLRNYATAQQALPMEIEVLLPRERGARESIHIALQEGALPGGGTVGSLAEEIARQIFAKLCPCPPPPSAVPALSPQRLQRVLAHIEEHLGDRVTVGQLAAVAHASEFHFARMFKRTTGTPPHAYMTGRRIDRAKELLARSELPLVEVAARVGFQTQAHFTVVFRRHVGRTPRIFRLHSQARIDAA